MHARVEGTGSLQLVISLASGNPSTSEKISCVGNRIKRCVCLRYSGCGKGGDGGFALLIYFRVGGFKVYFVCYNKHLKGFFGEGINFF